MDVHFLKAYLSLAVFWGILCIVTVASDFQTNVKEYCEWETFNATCKPTEIIMIRTALYGRMKRGRCAKTDLGHIGCGTDVTTYLDSVCSGRRHCELQVILLHGKAVSCSTELKLYLQAAYDCVPTGSTGVKSCPHAGYVTLNTTTGQIASSAVHETGIGSPTCPMKIQVEPYQRLNITMIDFLVPLPSDVWYPVGRYEPSMSTPCAKSSGYIVESLRSKVDNKIGTENSYNNVSLCAGTGSSQSLPSRINNRVRRRTSIVFVSNGNIVDVIINRNTDSVFMIKYTALGCPPLEAPAFGTVKTKGNVAVVECNETHEAWYLTCSGTTWIGKFTNCSRHNAVVISDGANTNWNVGGFLSSMTAFPYGILIVVALGIAIGVAIGILLLVLVLAYLRRRRQRTMQSRSSSNYLLKSIDSKYEIASSKYDETLRQHLTCSTLNERPAFLVTGEDPYRFVRANSLHRNPTRQETSTMQLGQIPQEREAGDVIMTSLPDPPTMAPPPIPVTHIKNYSSNTLGRKQHKTMDYNWDSVSITENEINELSHLREHLRNNAYSISYSDPRGIRRGGSDEPYYFKFDGVKGTDPQTPDVLSACTSCHNNQTDPSRTS